MDGVGDDFVTVGDGRRVPRQHDVGAAYCPRHDAGRGGGCILYNITGTTYHWSVYGHGLGLKYKVEKHEYKFM